VLDAGHLVQGQARGGVGHQAADLDLTRLARASPGGRATTGHEEWGHDDRDQEEETETTHGEHGTYIAVIGPHLEG
jgi:hypothetical protein